MHQNWDRKILFEIQKIRSSKLDKFMLFMTSMGNGGLIWIAISLILIINPIYRLEGLVTLITLGICAFIINLLVKPFFTRKRPFEQVDTVKVLINDPLDLHSRQGIRLLHLHVQLHFAIWMCQ